MTFLYKVNPFVKHSNPWVLSRFCLIYCSALYMYVCLHLFVLYASLCTLYFSHSTYYSGRGWEWEWRRRGRRRRTCGGAGSVPAADWRRQERAATAHTSNCTDGQTRHHPHMSVANEYVCVGVGGVGGWVCVHQCVRLVLCSAFQVVFL